MCGVIVMSEQLFRCHTSIGKSQINTTAADEEEYSEYCRTNIPSYSKNSETENEVSESYETACNVSLSSTRKFTADVTFHVTSNNTHNAAILDRQSNLLLTMQAILEIMIILQRSHLRCK